MRYIDHKFIDTCCIKYVHCFCLTLNLANYKYICQHVQYMFSKCIWKSICKIICVFFCANTFLFLVVFFSILIDYLIISKIKR